MRVRARECSFDYIFYSVENEGSCICVLACHSQQRVNCLFQSGFHGFSDCLGSIAFKLYAHFRTFLFDTRFRRATLKGESSASACTSTRTFHNFRTREIWREVVSREIFTFFIRAAVAFEELSYFLS